jgi:hypothetical protein
MKINFEGFLAQVKGYLKPWPKEPTPVYLGVACALAVAVQYSGFLNRLIFIQSVPGLIIMHFFLMYFFWLCLEANYELEYKHTFAIRYYKVATFVLFYAGILFFFYDAEVYMHLLALLTLAMRMPMLFKPDPKPKNKDDKNKK